MSGVGDDSMDVVVVGAGVAGASTAIVCGQHGLRTLLIESNSNARELPGETLHPGVEPLFHALGIAPQMNAAEFPRHSGYLVRTPQTSSTHVYGSDGRGPWCGYQADRARLHAILHDRAEECGVTILRGERVVSPLFKHRRIAGVLSTAGAHSSRFTVDASGQAHWLMRRLKLPLLQVSQRLIASYGWAALGEDSGPLPDSLPEFATREGGWDWTAPVSKNKYAWVSLDLESVQHELRSTHQDARPKRLAGLRAIGGAGARDVTWRIARPSSGPGYFLTGDAAWVLDPASSHGVLFAVMSAMATTNAIMKQLNSPQDEDCIQAGYSTWTEDWFCRDASALISLYSTMSKPPTWLCSAAEAVRYIAMSPSERAFSRSAS